MAVWSRALVEARWIRGEGEMIGLVASGHTSGGAQHDPFPDIVPELDDPNNSESVSHFDSTNTHFDNNVATEYIAGTRQNPFLVRLNDTTKSDKRIFRSDGNAIMLSAKRSPTERGYHTVAYQARRAVTLSGWRHTQFASIIRLWNLSETDQPVQILLNDHFGGVHSMTLPL
ncbi:hypothetical protein B0H13DRAFT_1884363 [Mycena leptocephala]|nr:hypothetical protein B0H13DRAFT_1884363 [Mycena leptocephala]